MGSVLSNESSRESNSQAKDTNISFDCAVCLEVLNRPTRTRCGHVFCQTCIKASLRNNAYACPYCRSHLSSEGTPASDIVKKMKTVFQNCEECEEKVCLSEMRAHLNTCEPYLTKYGPLEELGRTPCRDDMFACPFCNVELDEDGLVQHCITYHSTENRLVVCPICRLMPGGDSSYTKSFVKHLHARHSIYYENYIDINIVDEALIERVLDFSLVQYMRNSNRS
ncbi:E3 ubiquitin-protein ligase RNF125 [Bombina bombina]|uniref:E3 ubiquitin-protein ligase RNF125 n=1 Tax=Bombina bombina TaxID=8345 RepID=UPI00235AD85F|nr:E3 ubiquitin-protein ligase RNF125 [Bombina bombina]